MIILPDQDAVFVGVPRAASMSMHRWLELGLRGGEPSPFPVESMNEWHASLSEAAHASGFPLLRMWSFCIVRNPFDRLVSHCAFTDIDFSVDPRASVARALEEPETLWTRPQVHWAGDVETRFKYEQLSSAVEVIRRKLGIADDVQFPHHHEADRPLYRACFTDETRELASVRYADDLRELDYRF